MPIEYSIDHTRRLVSAKGSGVVADADVFAYQNEVWSRSDVKGYNELLDMTSATGMTSPETHRIRELAALSASMDADATSSKFAIVAPTHLAFAIGRMYEAYRALEPKSTKEVGVFRTLIEALHFLGIADTSAN